MGALAALQAIAAGLALAVMSYLLVRAPDNVPLRAITVTVASLGVTVVFGAAATGGARLLGLEPIMSRLVQHLGLIVGGYSLIVFYLYSALNRRAARRQAMRQAIPMAAAAVTVIAAAVLMPAGIRDAAAMLAFTRPDGTPLDEITVALLYLVANAYLTYALAAALAWTRRYARGAEPRLRRGLALTSVGLAALVLGETVFLVAATAQWAGLAPPRWLFALGLLAILPGSAVFVAGLSYPAATMRLAALAVWWRHRRTYHQLGPLWTLLHERFPHDTLDRVPSSWWRDAVGLTGVHRRYYRRVIECRDGLLRLSPYLAATGTGDDAPLADRVRDALRAHASGAPAACQAAPVLIPATDGLDADARELATLAKALRGTATHGETARSR